jgi:AcrR family transcriptional regulator/DNA-binding MarR family transcriptional regulator
LESAEISGAARSIGDETPQTGGAFVSQVQCARICGAMTALVAEVGYAQLSVDRVVGRAGVSRRTFYECFADLEACYLALFDAAVGQIATAMGAAYEREHGWPEQVRAALLALLELLEQEPAIGTLVFVEALAAGPRILMHRRRAIARCEAILGEGNRGIQASDDAEAGEAGELSPLMAEGVVNAMLGILHTRIAEQGRMRRASPRVCGSLIELINPLTAIVMLPYVGRTQAAQELSRPAPAPARSLRTPPAPDAVGALNRAATLDGSAGLPAAAIGSYRPASSPLETLGTRVTYRTLRVLSAIAERDGEGAGPSNREIADAAGITDQGQISRLLGRLKRLGLVEKVAGDRARGEPNAWALTPAGAEVHRAFGTHSYG